jgi:hypothetical protein
MAKPRDYRSEYQARKERALAKGTTYGKERGAHERAVAKKHGYKSFASFRRMVREVKAQLASPKYARLFTGDASDLQKPMVSDFDASKDFFDQWEDFFDESDFWDWFRESYGKGAAN